MDFRRFGLFAAAALLMQPQPASADPEAVGDVLGLALPATAYALTFTRDDQDGRRQFYESFGATIGTTWLLKNTVHKERPDGSSDQSFPSGHSAAAFEAASFIHRRYGIAAWPGYALATYTAWSRVEANKHDTADVLAGAALGIGSTFLFVNRRDVAVSAGPERDGFAISMTVGLR